MFDPATPILRVNGMERSLAYYTGVLGFQIKWQHKDVFACVARDRCSIFLSAGDQGHAGAWTWIGVPDADALCAEYRASGAMIRHPPTNYPWAYEMQVEDPDGNVLRFGSDEKPNEPFGAFLDMEGREWPVEA